MSTNLEKRVWGIHTNDESLFLHQKVIAIGWKEMGDLSRLSRTREAFKEAFSSIFPNVKKGSVASAAGMMYRFVCEVEIGDYVIYPSKSNRKINIGVIEGNYTYQPDAIQYAQQRRVKWLKHLDRTDFSQGALYEVGSVMPFFSVKNNVDEFLNAIDKEFKRDKKLPDSEMEVVMANAEEIQEATRDFVLKQLSRHLKGYALEGLVADLLNAMGYRTTVSAQGGDSGIDITAYKDELPPRILVQVKSQDSPIKEATIQSLKGAMKEGDYGLFVTLSSYTKNAQKYLDNTPIIRGINGTELVDLLVKHYPNLSPRYQQLIPLKRVYIPMPQEP